MTKLWHVALLIESSRGFGRGLLAGVADYLEQHGPWSIYFQPLGLESLPPRWLKSWQGDGILARIGDRRTADVVCAAKVPVVDLRVAIPGLGLPYVGIDTPAMVEMAFDHLTNCGLEHFGFCNVGRGVDIWMDLRCDLFRRCARGSGQVLPRLRDAKAPRRVELGRRAGTDRRLGPPSPEAHRLDGLPEND